MKKLSVLLCCILLLCFVFPAGLPLAVAAADGPGTIDAINAMVQQQMAKAKITSVSVAYISGGAATYLSYGEAPAGEQSLYQIGSTTKAFTALGVLWLEEEGLLSLQDPVGRYLPWLTVQYDGKDVPNEDLTIANLLYQTSGFTNDETKYPAATAGMTLEDSVRVLANAELAFYPSAQYAYANANYNILGLVIETVSKQSYQDFMDEKILAPLGLHHTYTNLAKAQQTGAIVQGTRLSFFTSHSYQLPVNEAKVPAGYIHSDIQDMSRWLQIHMGLIQVSDQFTRLVAKAHMPNTGIMAGEDAHYAAGWFVQSNGDIYHSGGTPNYSSRIVFNSGKGLGVCVLTNMNASANTEQIAANIMAILEGNSPAPYRADIWTVIDTIFSIATVVCALLFVLAVFFLVRILGQTNTGGRKKGKWTKKALVAVCGAGLLVAFSAALVVVFPLVFASTWVDLGTWAPYSLYTGTLALVLSSLALLSATIVKGTRSKNV